MVLLFCVDIFCTCEDLAKSLQGRSVTAHGAIEASAHALRSLQAKRSDDNTVEQMKKCLLQAIAFGLKITD